MTPFEESVHEGLTEMLEGCPLSEIERSVELGIDEAGEVIAQASVVLGIKDSRLPEPIRISKMCFEVRQQEVDISDFLRGLVEDDE